VIFERRLRLYIMVRLVVVGLFLASTIILKFSDTDALGTPQFTSIVALLLFAGLFSAGSLALLKRQHLHLPVTRLQIIWDVLSVTMLLLLTDGIASPYSFLYLLAIMHAGMLLDRRQALYTAALCIILYGALVDMQYYGLLQKIGLGAESARYRGEVVILYTIFLHLIGFVLAAVTGGHLAERARQTEQALRVTEVNYEELKQLHSTIVEQLESGLMTVTPDGLIRVFNPYLERLTGLTQPKAYGCSVSAVFPGLALPPQPDAFRQQGEFSYRAHSGDPLLIGYTLTSFNNLQGEPAGFLVTIRDLTSLKQMELALKRADRLAALGELSARMAHEIRNPLAAISGSVQLLAEHGSLRDHESRLLAIVLRESERLNVLITDFLAYARPRPPQLEPFDFVTLVSDLQELLAGDAHFNLVRLRNELPSELLVRADRDQLQQVLFNLLQNAADAMPDGGEIVLQADLQRDVDDAGSRYGLLRIRVKDQGVGMDPETCLHLFEPFWTTKPNGTGLGLATVYRIIEGHQGTVQVDPGPEGGTEVTLLLPMLEEEDGKDQIAGC
jgi:two-component system sensor histidine kinase PilS (NtrC family)